MAETRWVTLLEAPAREVAVVRGLLEDAGIATFVPDEVTKIVDPFITGPNPFQERLQVPEDDLERARGVLEAGRHALQTAAAAEAAGTDGGPDDAAAEERAPTLEDFEPDEEERAPDPVEDRAFLTIFFAVLLLTLPLAVIPGVGYLMAWRRTGRRSRYHAWVLVALTAPLVLGGLTWLLLHVRVPPAPDGPPRIPDQPTPIGPRPGR